MADNAANSAYSHAKISIFGAGSWGLTLAWLLGNAGHDVVLYTRSPEKAERLAAERSVAEPVKVELPASIKVTSNLREAASADRLLILACTSQTVRELALSINEALSKTSSTAPTFADVKGPVVVSAVKGLELDTLKRMSEVIFESIENVNPLSLSGPNLADEILLGMPAATVVSCASEQIASAVQAVLTSKKFRVYTNTDIIGTELGGSLK
ncbi:MAG: glycerol-3-phosphate dehydrogenase, partial [Cyanobacteria bacterium DS2.3.42]|nr:glycerol-3-phosphate dehydrogenase [Cyanobacteria bacterium DS2.3.42]